MSIPSERPIRVVVADDHVMVRQGLRLILESEPDIEVAGEASNGAEAIELVTRTRPDVLLVDIQMPVIDGLEATRRLTERAQDRRGSEAGLPAIVVLTTFDLDEYVYGALRAGASGFLLKNGPADELVDAVRVAARGDAMLSPAVTRRVIAAYARRRPPGEAAVLVTRLSDREREVLLMIARGLSNAEIAERLVLGEATVKSHVGSILAKLGARDRVAAVIAAYESGLVDGASLSRD